MYSRTAAALLCFAFAAPIALAQETAEPCADSESIQGCYQRILQVMTPAAAKTADTAATETQLQKSVDEELKVAETGADSGGAATAATMNDLAQLLNALGLVSSGDGAEGSKLAVDLNFLLPVQDVDNHNAQLKGIINTEAEPLDQLVQAFGEDVRATRKDSLQQDIRAVGDAQVSFTWSLVNSRFGRDYSVLRKSIAPMNEGAVGRAYEAVTDETGEALGVLVEKAVRAGLSPTDPIGGLSISDDEKQQYKADTFKAAVDRAKISKGIEAELDRTGMNRLADLVEQQPQLLFTLEHDFRDEIVGPETTTASVTWEFTRRNFGDFLRSKGKACSDPGVADSTSAKYDTCVSALQSYMTAYGLDLGHQPRFKIEASFKRVDAVTYSFPDDGVELALPKHDRWEVAVAAGRPLSSDKNGGRLDLQLSYDSNLDNDDTNKERVTASLTYTRRVGDMDMPFSIVYANKDEFLGEVDHQISMNVGLKFRQPTN